MGMREVCTAVFLAVNGWTDWKKREISLVLTGIYGVEGLILSIISERELWDFLIPLGFGSLFLLMGLLSDGALGMGDGWVLLSLGLMLNTADYIKMLWGGLFLTAVVSVTLLIIFKKNKKTELPFVPFLFWAYLGGIVI